MQITTNIKEKNKAPLNLFITPSLKERLEEAKTYLSESQAQFTREAINERVRMVEKEQLKLRMRAAYKDNHQILKEEGEVWDSASVEIIP